MERKREIKNYKRENKYNEFDSMTCPFAVVTIKKIHACMEGGILKENIKDVDICTIAPTIENIHSVNECVSISSTKRVYEWLKHTLIKYNSRGEND